MPERNRVTPTGEIVAITLRGALLGNRGSIHRGHEIVRPWQVRRWITCVLDFRGWRAPLWEPNRRTPLFFHDEAVALAAGHRPCALCRRADYRAFQAGWPGRVLGADAMDVRLHDDRLDGRQQRRHRRAWRELPIGAFVAVDDRPALVLHDRVVPWTPEGYAPPIDRPGRGEAVVLTPSVTVDTLLGGYPVQTAG